MKKRLRKKLAKKRAEQMTAGRLRWRALGLDKDWDELEGLIHKYRMAQADVHVPRTHFYPAAEFRPRPMPLDVPTPPTTVRYEPKYRCPRLPRRAPRAPPGGESLA